MKLEDIQRIQTEWKDYEKYFDGILDEIKPWRIGFNYLWIDKKNIIRINFSEYWADLSETYEIKLSKRMLESLDIKKIIHKKVKSRIKAQRIWDKK